jgi:hypothetical protein
MTGLPDEKLRCHHTGFKQSCRELVASGKCGRWMQIHGHNPSTGVPVNRYDCVDNWTPLLLIENSQMQRQTGAAVESFRNEVVRAAENTLSGGSVPALEARR